MNSSLVSPKTRSTDGADAREIYWRSNVLLSVWFNFTKSKQVSLLKEERTDVYQKPFNYYEEERVACVFEENNNL
ncbi:hypothetical protein TNCV_3706871 [Trichonephila clavipes]|nr:hypothetical protein TNCV_3706871 [Trichonephila clavipes]